MPGQAILIIGSKQWAVSLATTPQELARGLGGLPSLPAGTGMLFDLGQERPIIVTTVPMLFPLDIFFLNGHLQVSELALNIAPGYLVATEIPARYFLEVNAGEAAGVQQGQQAAQQIISPMASGETATQDLINAVFTVFTASIVLQALAGLGKRIVSFLAEGKPAGPGRRNNG